MRMNTANRFTEKTHEGAPAVRFTAEKQLRRSVLSCLLWEKEFYEDGVEITDRIESLCAQVDPQIIAELAVEAREAFKLRHVPLLLLTCLAKHGKGQMVGNAIERTIQRADELAELVAIYWRNGKQPLSAQMKKGLARAFHKFDAYQLAKYNRDNAVKLRDVLFLSHAKASNPEQDAIWKQLIDGTLKSPDTWEVSLSAGADKRETFERLIRDGKLGYLALLRNLRNMMKAGVDRKLVENAIVARQNGARRVLPFRYVAAARACPQLDGALDAALVDSINDLPKLPGTTLVLVDVSLSMDHPLSSKSDLNRMDAAAALSSIITSDELRVFSFSSGGSMYWGEGPKHQILVEVPPRRGLAGIDAVVNSQDRSCTLLGTAITEANAIPHDRLIVITDEQSQDRVPAPVAKRSYMINVASAKNGVGSGQWTRIDGFSENVIRYIHEAESLD